MHTTMMNLTLSRVDHNLRHIDRYVSLPGWLVRLISAVFAALATRNLNRIANDLSATVLDVVELTHMVERSTGDEQVDTDGKLAEHFSSMLRIAKDTHRKILGIVEETASMNRPRFHNAAKQLAALFVEYHEAIQRLAWAVLEHDADVAPHLDGYTASSPQEIELMLQRIAAGA